MSQTNTLNTSGAKQMLLAFASLFALSLFFSFKMPESFATVSNMGSILQATAVNGILAIACTFIIITGGIDLSVGFLMTFAAVIAGVLISDDPYLGLPMPVGIIGAIAAAAACGMVSGFLVAKLKITPFIATLAMMMLLKGANLIIASSRPIYFHNVEGFSAIAQESLVGKLIPAFPVPNGALVLFVVAIIAAFILNRTVLGRYTFALGSNEEAVRLSGVNVDKWKIIIYALAGAICGIAGLVMASRLMSAQPALGGGYELEAIAAVVIGGTSLSGGVGTILGTLIGAFIMSVLTNGLLMMGMPQEWQFVVTSIIIILAVYTDNLRRRKS